jgi:hypothetical protein
MKAQVDRSQSLAKITGLERLAAEIIQQAVKDVNGVGGDNHVPQWCKNSAKVFFDSQWFETLCDFLDVDPELIRQKLKIKGDLK